jgi:hypothetical protein
MHVLLAEFLALISTEQEPVRVFATVHFYLACSEARTHLVTAQRSFVAKEVCCYADTE